MIFVLKQANQEQFFIIIQNYYNIRPINICSRNVTFKHIDSQNKIKMYIFMRVKNS